jgi:chemotaxis protein methyltransferase CheR
MTFSAQAIMNLISKTYGKDFCCYHQEFFTKCMESRKAKLEFNDTEAYVALLLSSPKELSRLEITLTNHFSIFFRNPSLFYTLEQYFLPPLIMEKEKKGRVELRIWSMACAKGQEAYSLAMILNDLLIRKNSKLDFRFFCSDKSPACIQKAERGLFSKEDLEHTSLARVDKYFEKEGDLYRIKPQLKEKMVFICYDLFDPKSIAPSECIYNDFDIILCCNVLYYYSAQHQKRIIDKIKKSLGENGILITDDSEKDLIYQHTTWSHNTMVLPIFRISPKEST